MQVEGLLLAASSLRQTYEDANQINTMGSIENFAISHFDAWVYENIGCQPFVRSTFACNSLNWYKSELLPHCPVSKNCRTDSQTLRFPCVSTKTATTACGRTKDVVTRVDDLHLPGIICHSDHHERTKDVTWCMLQAIAWSISCCDPWSSMFH